MESPDPSQGYRFPMDILSVLCLHFRPRNLPNQPILATQCPQAVKCILTVNGLRVLAPCTNTQSRHYNTNLCNVFPTPSRRISPTGPQVKTKLVISITIEENMKKLVSLLAMPPIEQLERSVYMPVDRMHHTQPPPIIYLESPVLNELAKERKKKQGCAEQRFLQLTYNNSDLPPLIDPSWQSSRISVSRMEIAYAQCDIFNPKLLRSNRLRDPLNAGHSSSLIRV